jgi:hypothetical protein
MEGQKELLDQLIEYHCLRKDLFSMEILLTAATALN